MTGPFAEIDASLDTVADGAEPTGFLRLAVASICERVLSGPLIAGFIEAYPGIKVDVTVNRGDADSYRAVGAAMADLGCPVVYALGNHDDRAAYRQGLALDGGSEPAFGDRLIEGVHAIALDTLVPGRIGGAIDDGQFAWLEGALGRHAETPKLIVMHHPPAVGGATGWRTVDGATTDRLAALLRGRPVAAILSGHVHLDRVAIWDGVPVVTVSGHHAATDPLHGDGLRALRGASFGLCRIGLGGFSVTFVQAPSDRAELKLLPADAMTAFT